jgi:hypothetical protein
MARDTDIGFPFGNDTRTAVKAPSNVATGTLFTFRGTVKILNVIGKVTTQIQAQACTLRLGVIADSLSEVFLCTASGSVSGFAVGSVVTITGTLATAMTATTAVGVNLAQATAIVASCVTSGTIKLTTTATNTGVISWEILWQPLSQDGNISPA